MEFYLPEEIHEPYINDSIMKLEAMISMFEKILEYASCEDSLYNKLSVESVTNFDFEYIGDNPYNVKYQFSKN